ncbi:MAG: hypothetical protein AAFU73_08080 [Planctomycetota bacterium]
MPLALLALALAPVDVIDVGPTGAYADIQTAVLAAAEGDVLRIGPGTYDSFAVFGKSLTLVPAGSTFTVEGVVRVQNLGLGQTFTMQGATLKQLHTNYGEERLILGGNVGSVRIEGVRAETEQAGGWFPWHSATSSVRVVDCFDVSFNDCEFGVVWGYDDLNDIIVGVGAVRLIDSTVAMFGCTALAVGTKYDAAVSCLASDLLAVGLTAQGSRGSDSYIAFSGRCDGSAHGGSAAVSVDAFSTLTHVGCMLTGGTEGTDGCTGNTYLAAPPIWGSPANATEIDGDRLGLSAAYTATALDTIPVRVDGGLDDLTFLVMGPAAARRDLPGFVGDLLLGGPHGSVQRFVLGTGSLHTVDLPAPALGPLGIEALHLQAAHVRPDPTAPNGSRVMLGPPRVVTVLGSAW